MPTTRRKEIAPGTAIKGYTHGYVKLSNQAKRFVNGMAGPELRATVNGAILDGWEAFAPYAGQEIFWRAPVETGELRGSWMIENARVGVRQKRNGLLEFRYGSKHPASTMLELGGILRPKKAKKLAIPVRPEAVDRKPRSVEGLGPIRLRGKLFLGRTTPRGLELWYLLADSQRLVGFHYLQLATQGMEQKLVQTFDKELNMSLQSSVAARKRARAAAVV